MSCKGGVSCDLSCADAMERVHKSRTVVDDWSLWPSCSSPVTYGPRRHVRHRIGRALNLNISDHRSNQTRRAESRNDSFVSAASRAACTVWSMAIDQAPASEALLDSRNLQPAIRVECGLGAARVANPLALATFGRTSTRRPQRSPPLLLVGSELHHRRILTQVLVRLHEDRVLVFDATALHTRSPHVARRRC